MFLKCSLNLKAFNYNKIPDLGIVMQEKGCSDFVRHIVNVHSISYYFDEKFSSSYSKF